MTFLDGFFLVNFVPFALLMIVGIVLFFQRGDKSAKYYYPLLFIFLVLAIVAGWRFPLISDRRHAMPTVIPGIIACTFALMALPGIIRQFGFSHANGATMGIIAALLVPCAAKTLRPQESKPYLHKIGETIEEDCRKKMNYPGAEHTGYREFRPLRGRPANSLLDHDPVRPGT